MYALYALTPSNGFKPSSSLKWLPFDTPSAYNCVEVRTHLYALALFPNLSHFDEMIDGMAGCVYDPVRMADPDNAETEVASSAASAAPGEVSTADSSASVADESAVIPDLLASMSASESGGDSAGESGDDRDPIGIVRMGDRDGLASLVVRSLRFGDSGFYDGPVVDHVIALQREAGLEPDGVVRGETWALVLLPIVPSSSYGQLRAIWEKLAPEGADPDEPVDAPRWRELIRSYSRA